MIDQTAQRTPPHIDQAAGEHSPEVFSLLETPVVQRPDDMPGQIAVFWIVLQLVRGAKPGWPRVARWLLAIVADLMFQIAHTLHSTGHVISARQVGAPMEALVLSLGMQFSTYSEGTVTAQQHIGRAVGGPLMSGLLTGISYAVWRLLRPIPVVRDLAGAWMAANVVVGAASLLPAPSTDGGVLLNNTVALQTGDHALGLEALQQAGFATVGVLLMAAGLLLLRGKLFLAASAVGIAAFITADLLVFHEFKPR